LAGRRSVGFPDVSAISSAGTPLDGMLSPSLVQAHCLEKAANRDGFLRVLPASRI
jgi:hypothetical protein